MTISPMADIISSSFGDTVTIYPYASANSRGEPVYGPSRIAAARVQHKHEKIMKPDGEVGLVRSSVVFLSAGDTIANKDKVVMNDVENIVQLATMMDHVHDQYGNVIAHVVKF